jgi:AcrR family transcriptional regulator
MDETGTRDRILAAARDLFDREGVAGLSMRRIAGMAKITPMAIYKHFADKAALIDALMLDGFVSWEARVRAIRAKDPMRWLLAVSDAGLDFALSEPHRFEAAFLLPASHARRYPDDFAEGRSPVINLAYARIAEAKEQGLLGGANAQEIMLDISALMQGFVSMHRAGRFVNEAEFRKAYRRAMRRALDSYAKADTP